MEIVERPLSEIRPYDKNAKKHPDSQIKQLADSIREFGFNQPLVVDNDGVLIVGHGRYAAARFLGLENVPVVQVDLDEDHARAYRLADNKLAESGWDKDLLYTELTELTTELLHLTGFTELDLAGMEFKQHAKSILKDDFIIPPLSIWDTKMDYWQKRKELWREVFGDSREGRSDSLLGEGMNRLAKMQSGNSSLSGTSEFDPVVAEICYRWFCPTGGGYTRPIRRRSCAWRSRGDARISLHRHRSQCETDHLQQRADQGNRWHHVYRRKFTRAHETSAAGGF